MHEMSVKEKYYNLLKSGTKTIELRLFDEKRKIIKVDDVIEFLNGSDVKDTFKAKVIYLHLANSFEELCSIIDIKKAGFNSNDELLTVLEQFYPKEKQNKFGVVGIEVKKI